LYIGQIATVRQSMGRELYWSTGADGEHMRNTLVMTLLTVFACTAGGCWVPQRQNVPVPAKHLTEASTHTPYWLYVPQGYTPSRKWPLVITLHGTNVPPYDTYDKQINEWKMLAEEKQFIVVAPLMHSVQGVLPKVEKIWFEDLAKDERAILSLMDELCGEYNIDERCVLLTGFSSGGYPMYYTGLRNPTRFNALVARSCNTSIEMFESLTLTDAAKKMPLLVYNGKDDMGPVVDWSWQAFRWLREHGFKNTKRKEIDGGHIRRPDIAYQFWTQYMPAEHRR
jgi:poly(3-hydroxybutyrate) depolymerase